MLDEPLQVVLTEEEKVEYFGDDDGENEIVLSPEGETAWQAERARLRRANPPEVEFAAADAIGAPDAPKTGKWFVGRDTSGQLAHVRWRKDVDLEGDDKNVLKAVEEARLPASRDRASLASSPDAAR